MWSVLRDGGVRVTPERDVMQVLRDITQKKDQWNSFYVFDVDEVAAKVNQWKTLMPRVEIFYAVKCNDHRTLLEVLAGLGVGFDCCSAGEIDQVADLLVTPSSKIILAHPYKGVSHLRRAKQRQVSLMTFDSISELHKIKEYYPDARLLLRVCYDDPGAQRGFGEKFGVHAWEARVLLLEAKSLGLQVVGAAFHVGTNASNPVVYYEAIATVHTVFEEARGLGLEPYIVDVGGGFPGTDDLLMAEIAGQINAAIDCYFPENNIQVIGEPGRYLAMSAFTLAACVIGRKDKRARQGLPSTTHYHVSDGVFTSFLYNAMEGVTRTPSLLQSKDSAEEECVVWGQTCAPVDILCHRALLPRDLDLGDWLVWPNMGAYGLSLANNFSKFPKPEIHTIVSKELWADLQPILKNLQHDLL